MFYYNPNRRQKAKSPLLNYRRGPGNPDTSHLGSFQQRYVMSYRIYDQNRAKEAEGYPLRQAEIVDSGPNLEAEIKDSPVNIIPFKIPGRG